MWQHRATNCGSVCAFERKLAVSECSATTVVVTHAVLSQGTVPDENCGLANAWLALPFSLHCCIIYLQDISRRAGSLGLRPLRVIVPNGPPNSPSLSLLYKCWRGNRTRLNYSNKNNGLFCAATAFVICSPKRGLTHGWLTMGWGGRSSEIKRWEIAHRCCTFFWGRRLNQFKGDASLSTEMDFLCFILGVIACWLPSNPSRFLFKAFRRRAQLNTNAVKDCPSMIQSRWNPLADFELIQT